MTAPVAITPAVEIVSPFPRYAVPKIWLWTLQFRSRVADDTAPKTLDDFVRDWDAHESRDARRTFAIYVDEQLAGLGTFERWSPWCGTTHVLFCKNFWGKETTVPALREFYQRIFTEEGCHKLLQYAFADNYQLFAIAKEIGAKIEGTLREQTFRNGVPTDMKIIGLLREDFEKCLLP